MAGLLTIGAGAAINAFAFSGSSYLFSHINKEHTDPERIRHDKAVEQLNKAQAEWSKKRTNRLDFFNKSLKDQHDASNYISDVNDAAREYFLAMSRELPPKPTLSDFYHQ